MPSRLRITIFAVSLAFISTLFTLSKGITSISIEQLLFDKNTLHSAIFFQLRLPRAITAFVTGGLLALAGTLMQLLVQNPLADPYLLGISGGAAVATLGLLFFGIEGDWLLVGAWIGSLFTMAVVFLLARKHQWQTQTLLLSGIALACGYSALISALLLLSPAPSLHSMLYWLTGDLNHLGFPWIEMSILSIGLIICLMLAPGFNLLHRGELCARTLGLASTKYRLALYLLSALFTATAVTLAGCVGFIGLIIPHLTRRLVGLDHRIVLPLSTLLGGCLLMLADTLARTLIAPEQLPVGIIMTLLGVPVFIWLLQR